MKRLFGAFLTCTLLLSCVSCSTKKDTSTTTSFSTTKNGAKVIMELTAKDDTITHINQTVSVNLKTGSASSIDTLKSNITSSKESYANIKGVVYTITQTDTSLTEKISISISEKTIQTLSKRKLLPIKGKRITSLSLKQTVSSLKKAGWKEEMKQETK